MGANIEARTVNQRSPALEAAMAGKFQMVLCLLDRGADENAHTYYGWNMLHQGASHGKLDLVELLVSRGVDIEAKYSGLRTHSRTTNKRALHYAVSARHRPKSNEIEIVELLVGKGKATVSCHDSTGATPVHYAVRSDWKAALEILLRRATVTDISMKEASGTTPLDEATRLDDHEVEDMLKGVTSPDTAMGYPTP